MTLLDGLEQHQQHDEQKESGDRVGDSGLLRRTVSTLVQLLADYSALRQAEEEKVTPPTNPPFIHTPSAQPTTLTGSIAASRCLSAVCSPTRTLLPPSPHYCVPRRLPGTPLTMGSSSPHPLRLGSASLRPFLHTIRSMLLVLVSVVPCCRLRLALTPLAPAAAVTAQRVVYPPCSLPLPSSPRHPSLQQPLRRPWAPQPCLGLPLFLLLHCLLPCSTRCPTISFTLMQTSWQVTLTSQSTSHSTSTTAYCTQTVTVISIKAQHSRAHASRILHRRIVRPLQWHCPPQPPPPPRRPRH